MSALLTPNPAQPFKQTDWPLPKGPGKVQASDAPANLYPWQHPNPPRPFVQSLWENATKAWPKIATGEAQGGINPLFTPNPTQPFVENDWPSPVRVLISLKSDVYWGSFPLYSPNPAQPFRQSLWEGAQPRPKAIGEVQGGDSPLLTPNPAQPFSQNDWYQIRVVMKAKVDDVVNLLPVQTGVVVVTLPFNQYLWDSAALPRSKAGDSSTAPPSPLLTPNPAQPFSQDLWEGEPAGLKAKVDDFVNLTPLQTSVVVPFPFELNDWPTAVQPRPKITDTSSAASSPLYNPNPTQPFSQNIWDLARPAQPRSVAESIGTLSPLLTPNPSQPFVNPTEIRIFGLPPIKSEIFVNLLPLQSVPVVVLPFIQSDWPRAASPGIKIGAESLNLSLPLNFPNPLQPFMMSDWRNPSPPIRIDNAPTPPYNLPIATFVPPVGGHFEWLTRARRRGRR